MKKSVWQNLSQEEQQQRLVEIISAKVAPTGAKTMAAVVASASRSNTSSPP